MGIYEKFRDRLIKMAQEDHKDYPQYNDYFKGFELVEMRRSFQTKGGTAVSVGRMMIGKITSPTSDLPYTVYDPDTGHCVGVQREDFNFLTGYNSLPEKAN